jgi:ribosomal protein L31E
MDAIQVLGYDHRVIEQLFHDYETAVSSSEHRRAAQILVRELSKHATVEKLIVYPLAKDVLPQEEHVLNERMKDYIAMEYALQALDRLLTDHSLPLEASNALIGEIRQLVQEHVREDEEILLPRLAENLDQRTLEEFGILLEQAKHFAPSRPHLNMPDEPPALALAAPVAAAFDRIRDRLQGRPRT